jgi:ATP-dependent DNA helicase RecG
MIKVFADRLEISNNGGFIGGITESNILHHKPAARNPLLVTALTQLRLINRSNLGISRMYSYMLMEGKEPPVINEIGESVTVAFRKHELNGAFRLFVADEAEKGHILNVDELLILQRLLKQPEMDTAEAAKLCQRSENVIRDTLSVMEQHNYIEHGGKGRGTYWNVNPAIYAKLSEKPVSEKRRRIEWEAAKTRILSILKERAKRGESGLSNAEIRQITMFDRHQVQDLMNELRKENPEISPPGKGRYAQYEYNS